MSERTGLDEDIMVEDQSGDSLGIGTTTMQAEGRNDGALVHEEVDEHTKDIKVNLEKGRHQIEYSWSILHDPTVTPYIRCIWEKSYNPQHTLDLSAIAIFDPNYRNRR